MGAPRRGWAITQDQVAISMIWSVVGALLLLPPLAALSFHTMRSGAPRALRPAVLGCAGLIALVWLSAWAGFGLPSRATGCYAVLAAYSAFCFLVAAAQLVRPRALGLALGLAGWTVIGLGHIAATIGFLPLAWVIGGSVASNSSEQVAVGLPCEPSW